MIVQEDQIKQTVNQKLTLTKDFDYYNNEILSNITSDAYDLRMNSTSKFMFYHYNAVRENEGLKPAVVRHSQILKDKNALKQLQNGDWQYFIRTLLQNSIDGLGYEKTSSIEERNILDITADNLVRCKKTYREAYDQVAKYFCIALQDTPPQDIKSIQHDLRNKLYYTNSLLESARTTEILKVYNQYYAQTSAFLTVKGLVFIPEGLTPAFCPSRKKNFPKRSL